MSALRPDKKRPVIGITLGDPAGIGPEVVQAALKNLSRHPCSVTFRRIGEWDLRRPAKPGKKAAALALASLRESVQLLKSGEIQAVVNAPVHKANLARVGFDYPGQTEFYAEAFGLREEEVTMMMVSEKLNVALLSTHCSLKDAIRRITPQALVTHGTRLVEMLQRKGIRRPRIAVCGLNPHAGEQGLFGDDEAQKILPGIRALKKKVNAAVSGPHSPDAVFAQALKGSYDGVLCLYHDQGLIPFKLVAFEEGVNLTWGLPFIRVSPDHGTAFDIAGKGVACSSSMESALRLAVKLVGK